MNSFLSIASRVRLLQAISLAVALALLAAAAPAGLAVALPITAGGEGGSPPSYTVADCTALLQSAPYLQWRSSASSGLIAWHSDDQGYGLCHPAGWRLSAPDPASIDVAPIVQYYGARFSVQVMDMPGAMTADELAWRIHWFDVIVNTLPDTSISWQARWHSGNLTVFEAEYTYSDNDITFSRWVRLVYAGTRQYWLVAQAPSALVSGSLRPMLQTMMLTFRPDGQTDEAS